MYNYYTVARNRYGRFHPLPLQVYLGWSDCAIGDINKSIQQEQIKGQQLDESSLFETGVFI